MPAVTHIQECRYQKRVCWVPIHYPNYSSLALKFITKQHYTLCRPGNAGAMPSSNDCTLSPAMIGVDVTGGLDSCGFGGPGLSGCGKDT